MDERPEHDDQTRIPTVPKIELLAMMTEFVPAYDFTLESLFDRIEQSGGPR